MSVVLGTRGSGLSMSIDKLLSRLKRVRKLGADRWTACCPAHDDRHPSLSIRQTSDGTTLIRCHSGCGAAEVVRAVGMELSQLFPARRLENHSRRLHRPFFRDQVFELLRHEATIVWLVGCDIHARREITERDYHRLCQALAVIERIAEGTYGL
jgi:hypothetical protein